MTPVLALAEGTWPVLAEASSKGGLRLCWGVRMKVGGDSGIGKSGESRSPLVSLGTCPGCHPRWLGDDRPP